MAYVCQNTINEKRTFLADNKQQQTTGLQDRHLKNVCWGGGILFVGAQPSPKLLTVV